MSFSPWALCRETRNRLIPLFLSLCPLIFVSLSIRFNKKPVIVKWTLLFPFSLTRLVQDVTRPIGKTRFPVIARKKQKDSTISFVYPAVVPFVWPIFPGASDRQKKRIKGNTYEAWESWGINDEKDSYKISNSRLHPRKHVVSAPKLIRPKLLMSGWWIVESSRDRSTV